MSETKHAYLTYVSTQLHSIDSANAVVSYDTGYGLHVCNAELGTEVHAMDVRCNSILKIRTPDIQGEEWYEAWSEAVEMVYYYCQYRKSA